MAGDDLRLPLSSTSIQSFHILSAHVIDWAEISTGFASMKAVVGTKPAARDWCLNNARTQAGFLSVQNMYS